MKKILEPIGKLMKTGLSKETGWTNGRRQERLHSPRHDAARRFSLYGEDYFLKTLHLERKRSERCLRPFCLMLLDLSKCTDTPARRQTVKKISSLLHSVTRETDIKGWYEFDSVIGVIFTETSRQDAELLKKTGPSEVSFINRDIMRKNGKKIISPITPPMMSIIRLNWKDGWRGFCLDISG